MTLDYLLEYTEKVKKQINSFNYDENDVRYSFYGLFYSTIYDYYIGRISYKLAENIANGDILLKKRIFNQRKHIDRLYEIQHFDYLSAGYYGNLNRALLFGSWTDFELSISCIFKYLATEEEIEKIIKKLNKKLLKKISFPDKEQEEIISLLMKSSFIPWNRKFNFIVKYSDNCYERDLKKDREFLIFFSHLRNCMIHSNGIYYGSDFKYKFKNVRFLFKKNQVFEQYGPESREIFWHMAIRLKEVFTCLKNCIKDINYIAYSEDEEYIA